MSTVTCEARRPASTREAPAGQEQHFVLPNVPWESYLAIGNAVPDRAGFRLTYDRGNLEFMTTSPRHEVYKHWLNRFIETIAEELNRPIAPGGNMTFQSEDLEKGLEGDEVFWIEHEPQMRGKLTWDSATDPPPDLFLEIEVSRNVLDRLAICASLRIPEVWSFDGERIRVYQLQKDGSYHTSDTSRFFPEIPIGEIARFLNVETAPDYLSAVREFRAWLRRILEKPPGS
jgi:hypothetical protein